MPDFTSHDFAEDKPGTYAAELRRCAEWVIEGKQTREEALKSLLRLHRAEAELAGLEPKDPGEIEAELDYCIVIYAPEEDAEGPGGNRPVIHVATGDLRAMVDQAEAALLTADLGLYQRGPFIVRPGLLRIAVSEERTATSQRILEVGDHALLEAMTTAADWRKHDGRSKTWVPIDAPEKVVKAYRARVGHWRLSVLTGIVNAPTLRPDGSLLAKPGYDVATGLLFDPRGADFPAIPDRPTREDADAALQLFRDLLDTFPFVSAADRAVAYSAILTACIRRSLPTAPMHGFSAPVAGSGKTMLVDIAAALATGREAAVIAQGATEEEAEKRLGAMLLAGEQVIAIDNCERPLGGELLCQMLTQPVVRARILGRSEAPELPTGALVTATGNNLTLIGDMTRRALLCRLDPGCERPELRRFDRNPVAVVKAERGRYVAAALTVLRAFHVAGRPRYSDPLGSFDDWSSWVRDALIWLGEEDPVATMEKTRERDPRLDALTSVVSQWHAVIRTAKVTVREVIELATQPKTDSWGRVGFIYPDFREALLTVAGEGGAINSRKLGRWLLAHQDRVVSFSTDPEKPEQSVLSCHIARMGLSGGTMTWLLETD